MTLSLGLELVAIAAVWTAAAASNMSMANPP
jgi:hypothetical protein